MCAATRKFFEGAEYRRGKLREWNTLTLKKVINRPENSKKTPTNCLHLRTQKLLYNKLISACRDVPAYRYACFKPADDLAGVIEELRSSIATYEESRDNTSALFTDRRYHTQKPLSTPSHTQRLLPAPTPLYRKTTNRQLPQTKRCFVCQKEGCWSTKHTREEREQSKRKHKERYIKHYDRNIRHRTGGNRLRK